MFNTCFELLQGSGKAFSAGGDVVCLYQFMDEGGDWFWF